VEERKRRNNVKTKDMKTKEDYIKEIKQMADEAIKKIEKVYADSKPNKNKEMSDFLFSMFFPTEMRNTGEKEFTFYNKKDEWMFQQDYKNSLLRISYDRIWKVFEDQFDLNDNQIRNFIAAWVETNTNWQGLTPKAKIGTNILLVETNTNWQGLTPNKI